MFEKRRMAFQNSYLAVLMILTLPAAGQVLTNVPPPGQIQQTVQVERAFMLPGDTLKSQGKNADSCRQVALKNGELYRYNCSLAKWVKIISGSALDSARRSNDTLYFRTTEGGEIGIKLEGIQIPGVVGLQDSLNSRFPNNLNGLSTYPDSVIQPTDVPLRAFEKIQGQLNGIIGRYIENQDTAAPSMKFRISGSGTIRSSTQTPNLTLQRGPEDTTYAILSFQDYEGERLGYVGAASFTDPNSINLLNYKSRLYYVARDTASHIFGSYTGSIINSYTFMRNGHWRFYNSPISPFLHDHTNYDPAYTIRVDGQLRYDTLRSLNYTSASATTNGFGKYLSVDANGDVKLYDLRATTAYLNGAAFQYTSVSDTADVISGNTNWNWRLKMRRTGGIMYDALFVKGSNGFTGIGTVNTSATLTVRGSIAKTHTVTAGSLSLSDTHCVVRVSNSSHTITLPSAATCFSNGEGRVYTIINYNTGGAVTISSVQVYGSPVTTIPDNTSWVIQSDGVNWILISRSN